MSACHDVVAMETFQPNIVYVAAIWSSGADLNRPEEFVAVLLSAFVCSPLGSLRKVFGQRKQRSVCVGVTKGKKKIIITDTHLFPTSGMTEQRDVWFFCPRAARNVSNTHRWSPAEVAGGERTECWWERLNEYKARIFFFTLFFPSLSKHILEPGGHV